MLIRQRKSWPLLEHSSFPLFLSHLAADSYRCSVITGIVCVCLCLNVCTCSCVYIHSMVCVCVCVCVQSPAANNIHTPAHASHSALPELWPIVSSHAVPHRRSAGVCLETQYSAVRTTALSLLILLILPSLGTDRGVNRHIGFEQTGCIRRQSCEAVDQRQAIGMTFTGLEEP